MSTTPSTEDEWRHIAKDFENVWDLPHTIGAIDGKHIRIECPRNSGSYYHNYKSFFSLFLLAVCDARYNLTLVDVGQYGSNNDSGVLKDSEFEKSFKNGDFKFPAPEKIPGCSLPVVPYFLVGDEIFPLENWLMRPYPGVSQDK